MFCEKAQKSPHFFIECGLKALMDLLLFTHYGS